MAKLKAGQIIGLGAGLLILFFLFERRGAIAERVGGYINTQGGTGQDDSSVPAPSGNIGSETTNPNQTQNNQPNIIERIIYGPSYQPRALTHHTPAPIPPSTHQSTFSRVLQGTATSKRVQEFLRQPLGIGQYEPRGAGPADDPNRRRTARDHVDRMAARHVAQNVANYVQGRQTTFGIPVSRQRAVNTRSYRDTTPAGRATLDAAVNRQQQRQNDIVAALRGRQSG